MVVCAVARQYCPATVGAEMVWMVETVRNDVTQGRCP